MNFNDKNKTVETADGTTYVTHLAQKATIELIWSGLTDEEIGVILKHVEVDGDNRIDYYDYTKGLEGTKSPGEANTHGYFYVDSRGAGIAFMVDDKIHWEDFSLKFIEH